MALTQQQLDYLRTADQRFQAHVAIFPAYTPTIIPPTVTDTIGTPLAPKPILGCSPRYSVVDNNATQLLWGRDSYNRGGGYVGNGNISAALHAGASGGLVSNGDGTFTYTAPAVGSGVDQIDITVTNTNGSKVGHAYVAYPKNAYDNTVAEIASLSGNLDQHGWQALMRVRGGAVQDFAIGKRILLHIEDTWAGTTSTFGGYQYPEGVLMGYISNLSQFEDYAGDTWLGVEIKSPSWKLSRIKIGEVYWGTVDEAGKLWIRNFTPADSIWHIANELTDITKEHNLVLWSDRNVIDDFITQESDLSTLFDDIMGRGLGVMYADRYGSIFCVPDPDVRADEYWGTPASTYTLTPDFVENYTLHHDPQTVRKLTLVAVDSSKLGLWAISDNPTAEGDAQTIRTLICDNGETLMTWVVQMRAKLNRPWYIEATHPLNHVLDLNNFVDAVFTAPALTSGLTASGQVYSDSISYRPNIADGSWEGSIRYLYRTEGLGEAETGAISAFGGSGNNWTGRNIYSGGWYVGSGSGSWYNPPTPALTWCYLFDFVNSGNGGFTASAGNGITAFTVSPTHVPGVGWSAGRAHDAPTTTFALMEIIRHAPVRTYASAVYWIRAEQRGNIGNEVFLYLDDTLMFDHSVSPLIPVSGNNTVSAVYPASPTNVTAGLIHFDLITNDSVDTERGDMLKSALFWGYGPNPFGADNC